MRMRWVALVVVVASCWRHSDPPPPQPPPHQPAQVPPPSPTFAQPPTEAKPTLQPAPLPAAAPQPLPACAKDQISEMQCGSVINRSCPANASTLEGYGQMKIFVSHDFRAVAREFVFDEVETAKWLAQIGSARGPNHEYCCYSRCTTLAVARSAPAAKAPAGHHLSQMCIPPPQAGTTVPAASAPACPAAIKISNRSLRFLRQTGDCCYEIVQRNPPPNGGHCPTCKCAAEGTPVATPTGEIAIESLAVGDLVMSMHAGRLQPVAIARISRTPASDHVMVVAHLDNGRSVSMSPLHPLADGSRFDALAAGAQLGDARVIRVERVPYTAAFTYDILPGSDTGTYVAAGALVGSTLVAR